MWHSVPIFEPDWQYVPPLHEGNSTMAQTLAATTVLPIAIF
jgi:hypothetical protein